MSLEIRRHEKSKARRNLLAVDDSRLILEVIETFFARQGWNVVTAENVAAARAALAAGSPDVIVSDIIMPGTDGWTFFEEVRRRDDTAAVPFVFLTVEKALPDRLRGLKLGADEYMTKPFAVEELHARIERLLDKSAALKRAAIKGEDALLSGSAAHLAICDLLQILALNGKSGTVRLQRADDSGRIDLANGRIVDAQAGLTGGTKALFRMLSWESATFRVVPRDGEGPARTIDAATSTLLMEGIVSLDDWTRLQATLPAPGTRVELARDALRRMTSVAPTPAALDLIARARDGITVERAIEESPHPDAEVAEAICTLLDHRVLTAVSEGSKTPVVSR